MRVHGSLLYLDTTAGAVCINLTTAVQAVMYDRPLTRRYVVETFVVCGVYPMGDAVKVHLLNEEQGLLIPLIFTPMADGVRVTLPAGQIVEHLAINRKILALDLLPQLMTSQVGDEGYFLLPDYSGTLVRFAEHTPTINRDRLYMDQAEWEKLNLMNCFAMRCNNAGVLAIVHKGDYFCHVVTEVNQEGKNHIYASFGLRHTEGEVIKQEDKELIVYFSTEADADYPAMARVYHRYLVHERGVSPLKARLAENPVLQYAVTAMQTKLVHAHRAYSIDGSGEVAPYTTFTQAEEVLDGMYAAGIRKAIVTLMGWNLGGHDGAYPNHFPVEPTLGDEDGLRRLIEKAKGLGYQCVPHDNVTDVYRVGQDWDSDYVARTAEGELRVVGVWGGGQSYKACPVTYFERWGYEMTRIRALGFAGIYYMDAQASVLWTCHHPRHPADEEQYAISLAKMTQWARAWYGAVSTELAPAYNLPFIDEAAWVFTGSEPHAGWLISNTPAEFQRIIDRIVPFYNLAIHGLITYQNGWIHQQRQYPGGVRQAMLRELAIGARPCMEISYRRENNNEYYIDCIHDVWEAYHLNFDILADIHVEPIIDYIEHTPQAVSLTYANGTQVRVNWGETPVADMEPLSYIVTRADGTRIVADDIRGAAV